MVSLSLYQGEEEKALELIKAFWGAHNQVSQSDEEARRDLLGPPREIGSISLSMAAEQSASCTSEAGERIPTGWRIFSCCRIGKAGASEALPLG